ncbi:MAG: hypothetical protein AB8I08_32355 [Sandaracinaceae bacterium]
MRLTPMFLALCFLVGCNNSHGRDDDAGRGGDAGVESDASVIVDAGRGDAGGCQREPEEHRPGAGACDDERPYPSIDPEAADISDCARHEDCTDGLNGRCVGSSFHGYRCTYDGCFADDECGEGPCACGGRWSDANRCVPGDCQVDADCGPGGYCSPSLGSCGDYGGVVGYFCHSCDDECVDDSDCPDTDSRTGVSQAGYCAFSPEAGRWQCSNQWCAG